MRNVFTRGSKLMRRTRIGAREMHTTKSSIHRRRQSVVSLLLAATLVGPLAAQERTETFKLEEATIADIQQAIVSREVTTVEIVHRYLARIKAYNGTCVNQPEGILGPITTILNAGQINALSTLNLRPATRDALGFDARKARSMIDAIDMSADMPDALEVAAAQDRRFRQTGELVGPLHGVVMAVKDQYDTFDMRTTSGADAPYANDRPPDDATFVQRLRNAGAIILAKSNLAEYATDGGRSSFGGTFCNPYDTERVPGMSSAGSATAVAANLVTCAIAEETVVSIRWPASVNSLVGLAPTQELVSRDGMVESGLNTRTGPVCRTVSDAARVLDAIAGYDPKDELTVFSVGRTPERRYADFATAGRLEGVRIGVVREYMDKRLFSVADEESIDLVEAAIEDLRQLGATVVDPGREGALFQDCIARYAPQYYNRAFAARYPDLFPVDENGEPTTDHIALLVAMGRDPSLVPADLSLRSLRGFGSVGESKFMMNRYLAERGDANIGSNVDLIEKGTFYRDPNFPDRRQIRARAEQANEFDASARLLHRFALRTILLQCMQEQELDALVSPTASVPPPKLGAPREPTVNGRPAVGWSLIGQQGFPVLTVPAGFTTKVWDRVRDAEQRASPAGAASTRLVGPIAARLPVGLDLTGRPFDEPVLFRIASAYEAATRHRTPPTDFGPLQAAP
jgi:amidase